MRTGTGLSIGWRDGTPEEVRQVCEEAIRTAYPGYFIGSTTELDNGSRLENILTMLDVAWNYPVNPGEKVDNRKAEGERIR